MILFIYVQFKKKIWEAGSSENLIDASLVKVWLNAEEGSFSIESMVNLVEGYVRCGLEGMKWQYCMEVLQGVTSQMRRDMQADFFSFYMYWSHLSSTRNVKLKNELC